jgi:hypothetical protein
MDVILLESFSLTSFNINMIAKGKKYQRQFFPALALIQSSSVQKIKAILN